MSAKFAKQPNGKFCRVSSVIDGFTHYNMSEREFRQELMNCNYGYCCDSRNHISAENEVILRQEMESTTTNGKFLVPFEHCLFLAWNYDADEIEDYRLMLKKMGYEKYADFCTWKYLADTAREEVLEKYFDEYKPVIINYLLEHYAGNDKYCRKTYDLSCTVLSKKIESIKVYDDLKALYNAYFSNNFSSIGRITENIYVLDRLVDYIAIEKKFRSQMDISVG